MLGGYNRCDFQVDIKVGNDTSLFIFAGVFINRRLVYRMRHGYEIDQASGRLPIETINLVGPDTLTGTDAAAIWSDILGRPIAYGGDDPSGFEQNMAAFMPKWTAYEMRLMAERYVSDGMIPKAGDVERLTKMLGRPLHAYRDFAAGLTGQQDAVG